MLVNSYKNLLVYQKAEKLSKDVICYLAKFNLPRSKEFATLQLLRAVTSIGANIAEGYGRYYQKHYRQFLSIARGSSFETDFWLGILSEFNDFDKAVLKGFQDKNTEISKMLTTLMKNIQQKIVHRT